MKFLAFRRSPAPERAFRLAPARRSSRLTTIEALESRIAPATLAALPGNSNFEDPTDFASWTVSKGPVSTFTEYLNANVQTTIERGAVALAPEGDAFARLSFQGKVTSGTAFGPSLQSETFTATAGEDISVVWRATNAGDVAHPRGRLFDAATNQPVATFFDADTGTTNFATATVTTPSAGQYYLLFEAGSSDVTAGGLIGATLDIDAIHRNPNGVTTTTLGTGQLTVDVSSEDPQSNAANNFLITLDATATFAQIFVNGSLDFIQPLASIDRINVTGRGGNDTLTIDTTRGLITLAEGIFFDGGDGTDTLALTQTNDTVFTSDAFTVGPNAGAGTSVVSGGNKTQTVSFTNVEPVLDNLPATTLTITATSGNNTINSVIGAGGGIFTGTTAKVSVDGFSTIEFNRKSTLSLLALGGSDTVTINHPTTPAGLTGISVEGAAPTTAPGDTLQYLTAGGIVPSAAGAGTIVASGKPTVSFSGFEVAATAGITTTAGLGGLEVTATGDQGSPGQDDTFAISTNATTQYLSLSLNGAIALYAQQSAIARITTVGLGGDDSVSINGTANDDLFTFSPTAADAGTATLAGLITVDYATLERVILNGGFGADQFKIAGSIGAVRVIGGSGSDRIDFSDAPSGIVLDLDLVGADQFVNPTGQTVNLGDVIENFTGTSYNDSLRVNAANFTRDLNGGANTNEVFPPGDTLSFDGQQKVVTTTLVSANTGLYVTASYADVTFTGFETPTIANSPSGPGFGTPDNTNAFTTALVYDLRKSTATTGRVTPGRNPSAVATADLDGDGFEDMITVNSTSGSISVLMNQGDGTFGVPVSYRTGGAAPKDLAIGNFDANPGLDVAVTNYNSSTLAIFSGDGNGGFGAPTLLRTAGNPLAIAVGEMNNDGIDDLVVTHISKNRVSVLLGTGTGFAPAQIFNTLARRPVDVVIADFNGDGKADVVTANAFSNSVSFLAGDGAGGLLAATTFATGKRPTAVVAADFDLDGKADLAVSNRVSKFVSVLFSKGAVAAAEQFQPELQVALPGKHTPVSLTTADINNDGFADLALGNNVGTTVTVLIGGNLGKFSQPYEFDLGKTRGVLTTSAVAIADLNNDGLLDLITTGRTSSDVRTLLHRI